MRKESFGRAGHRRLLTRWLKSWRCRHAGVASGEEALKKLLSAQKIGQPFDVAILERHMKGMGGEELGRKIKEDSVLSKTLLVMLSSRGQRGDVRKVKEVGFSAYLPKPAEEAGLYQCLTAILGRPVRKASCPIVTRYTLAEAKRRKARILLAEDNSVNRKVALAFLEKLGYQAEAVTNGREAIQALQKKHYDLVLMDLQMPEMDGYEATRHIREENVVLNPKIPIVALTAHAMKRDQEKCLKAGMNDYISKPIQLKVLGEVIERSTLGQEKRPGPWAGGSPEPLRRFEWGALVDRLMGDEELAKKIMTDFLKDTPQQIAVTKEALAHGDRELAERKAHSIKGIAADMGGQALAEVAARMEKACAEGNLEEAAKLLPDLGKKFAALEKEIERSGWDEKNLFPPVPWSHEKDNLSLSVH
ncbi:MAG: response regulator [Deltaproteobacteria bacterium]|nr:response regulator [Deltaproteobacteria bacterium]